MEPGKWIRALREERLIKPSDVERITRTVADVKGNSDFYVPHSTLADIEAGSIPSIHKLFSLAISLKVPLNELLLPFGIDRRKSLIMRRERDRMLFSSNLWQAMRPLSVLHSTSTRISIRGK